ncbi:DUF3696 domain-containing protein [Herbidospora daliensis]|uniref:DUF3696 domain-containing protein n=1 Tax=Herbidospora daliensis TaxID=295585 RepID=UPI000783D7FC|nr:DUF3696 domain-containing protein [Herbidospora daliensis]
MSLLRMAVENYRCFKERQEIELRPITVILGKNNSGKSALTRLPLLLETGINSDSSLPLDLDRLGDDPPDFLDLVYGNSPHRPLRIEFSTEVADVTVTIQNIAELHTQVVSEFAAEFADESLRVLWQQNTGPISHRTIRNGEPDTDGQAFFLGILPRNERPVWDIVHSLPAPSYLGPFRHRPQRMIRLPARPITGVGPMGEHAAGMLVSDHVRGGGLLIEGVNELLGDGLAGWQLAVESHGPVYSVILRSTTDPGVIAHLPDAGTGVTQVLPLLIQLLQPAEGLQVVEEPELHLHPAFHAMLADLFIHGMNLNSGRFLIETHSETMLLRLRRRIAEGVISHDDVAIHYVEHANGASRVRQISIDEFGNVGYWPDGVFSEDFEETKKLAEAQMAREGE